MGLSKFTLVEVKKRIDLLRRVLIRIEQRPLEDQHRFIGIISGVTNFLENELDPDLH